MIGLLSYGNQIRCGTYTLHSKFTSAANFFSDNGFAFVVDARVGAGPLNIVVDGIRLDSLRSLEIKNDYLYLNNDRFSFSDSSPFDSNIHIEGVERNRLRHNIKVVESTLIKYSPPKSLAFLLDPGRKKEFVSSFDLAIARRLEEGYNNIHSGYYQAGVETIKGLGYGLTPSGDDFISGFLIGLHVSQIILTTDFSHIIGIIHRTAAGSNSLRNVFLQCAAEGYVSEKFKCLICALCYSDEPELVSCTRRLQTVGATSGTDQAVGFLIAMKRFIV